MRMVLIAAVALLMLGGGGAGAYFYFSKKAEASAGAEGEVAANHEKNKNEKKGGHGAQTSEFVELDPLILPVVDNSGVSQVVSLVIALEVKGVAEADHVKKMTPKLKDAYIQDLYGILNKHAAVKGGVIQIATLKERLNKITADVLGEDAVDEVLLQVVQQRPI